MDTARDRLAVLAGQLVDDGECVDSSRVPMQRSALGPRAPSTALLLLLWFHLWSYLRGVHALSLLPLHAWLQLLHSHNGWIAHCLWQLLDYLPVTLSQKWWCAGVSEHISS